MFSGLTVSIEKLTQVKMACNMILRLAMTIVCALAINVSAFTDDYWRQRHEIVKNNTDKLASARGGDELNTKRTAVLNQIALDSFIGNIIIN